MPPVNRKKPIRALSSDSEYTLMDFMREFPDDDACLNWLWRQRYSKDGTNAYCQKCKQDREFARYKTGQRRQSWTCTGCGYHLHPTAGTIFHKSSTSLHLWFYAMYLITSTRCGISAKQLEREVGVTYKTAWRMMHLIRTRLMSQDGGPFDSGNPVEVDETYIGGRRRGTRGGRPSARDKMVPVLGLVQRKGRVVAKVVPNVKRTTVFPHITKHVPVKGTVYTDQYPAYTTLNKLGYSHGRVNHEEVWVDGDVHTNTIEGFWSLTKRGINGVYHAVSPQHLQGYLMSTPGGLTNAITAKRSSQRFFAARRSFDGFSGAAAFLRLPRKSLRLGTGMTVPFGVLCVCARLGIWVNPSLDW